MARALGVVAALRLGDLVEVMRPRPVQALEGLPAWVRGMAVVRGAAVPVVDLGCLLAGRAGAGGRSLSLRAGERTVALLVDEVIGIRTLKAGAGELPPLFAGVSGASAVAAADRDLMVVLDAARLVPPELWPALEVAP